MRNAVLLIFIAAIAGAVAITGYHLAPAFWYFVVFQRLSNVIARDAGIHPFLASSLAAIFSMALVETLWHLAARSAETRRLARWALALELAVYFAMLAVANYPFNFSGGKEIVWAEVRPDGVIERSPRPVNPYTNQPNIQITAENVRLLDGKPAQRINVDESTAFFDSFGNPRLWCGRDHNGVLQFYDKPGRHPQTGEPLSAPTKESVNEALAAAAHAKTEAQIVADAANPPHKVLIWPGMPLLRDDSTPLYWFVASANRFELYDRDGFDPLTHTRLQPLTPQIAHVLDQWIRDEMARGQRNLNDFELYLRKYSEQKPYAAHR
jgi:hypothetical protein